MMRRRPERAEFTWCWKRWRSRSENFDPSDTMNPVAQAFRSVARLTERPFKGDSLPHSSRRRVRGVGAAGIELF